MAQSLAPFGGASALDLTSPRRRLAPNVIALWPEDRPRVVNQPCRGRYPRGVERLRVWERIRPGVYAYLWNQCLPCNHGVLVQVLERTRMPGQPQIWWKVRSVTRPLVQANLKTGETSDASWEATASDINLRRCAAPKGVNHG